MTTYRIPMDGTWLGEERCPSTVFAPDTAAPRPCPGSSHQDGEVFTSCTWFGHQWRIDIQQILAKYGISVDTDADKVARVQAALDNPYLAWTTPQRRALEQALTGADQ